MFPWGVGAAGAAAGFEAREDYPRLWAGGFPEIDDQEQIGDIRQSIIIGVARVGVPSRDDE